MSVSAIFDYLQIARLCDTQNFVHICESHPQMDGEDRLRLRRNCLFDQLRVHAIGIWIDIHENRYCVHQENRPDRAFPGVGRCKHLVPGANSNRFQGRLNCNRSGVYALRVLGGVNLGKFLGECQRVLAGERLAAPLGTREDVFERE